jgi:hypothetical protein
VVRGDGLSFGCVLSLELAIGQGMDRGAPLMTLDDSFEELRLPLKSSGHSLRECLPGAAHDSIFSEVDGEGEFLASANIAAKSDF